MYAKIKKGDNNGKVDGEYAPYTIVENYGAIENKLF